MTYGREVYSGFRAIASRTQLPASFSASIVVRSSTVPSGFCTETVILALEAAAALWLNITIGLVAPANLILPEPRVPYPSSAPLCIAKHPPSPSEDSLARPKLKLFLAIHHKSYVNSPPGALSKNGMV